MTLISNSDSNNHRKIEKYQVPLKKINQIIDILGQFKKNYDKKFNFSKLVKYLDIPNSGIEDLISLFLNFQEMFEDVFKEYYIKKKWVGNQLYLITEKKPKSEQRGEDPIRNVEMTTSQINLFNDIIYVFKFVKRGKGFNITKNGTELSHNVKVLKSEHPYLFTSKGNGIIYPSFVGLKLGELIISYNKSNKEIKKFSIENFIFEVIKDKG